MPSTQDTVRHRFESQIQDFQASEKFQRLEAGSWTRPEYLDFIGNVARAHMNSPRIMAFLFSVAPPKASHAVAMNMLEELGAEGPGSGHPRYLETMLARSGLGKDVQARIRQDSSDLIHNLCCDPPLFATLRELGLSVLLEVSSFEWMLSQLSGRIGRALEAGTGLDRDALAWFFLHAEADIEHAQEALVTIAEYVEAYRFTPAELETFLDLTFRENVYLARYFFKSYQGLR